MAKTETEAGRTAAAGDRSSPPQRGRIGYVVIAIVAAVTTLGFAYVMGSMGGNPNAVPQIIAYQPLDDHTMEIRYSVHKGSDVQVRCTLRVKDQKLVEVGKREVDLPRGTKHVERTDRIATSSRGIIAEVLGCHPI